MASARKRGKKFMALYRDGDGRQKSAGSYATKKAALDAAKLAEAGIMPVKTEWRTRARFAGSSRSLGTRPDGWPITRWPRTPRTCTSR